MKTCVAMLVLLCSSLACPASAQPTDAVVPGFVPPQSETWMQTESLVVRIFGWEEWNHVTYFDRASGRDVRQVVIPSSVTPPGLAGATGSTEFIPAPTVIEYGCSDPAGCPCDLWYLSQSQWTSDTTVVPQDSYLYATSGNDFFAVCPTCSFTIAASDPPVTVATVYAYECSSSHTDGCPYTRYRTNPVTGEAEKVEGIVAKGATLDVGYPPTESMQCPTCKKAKKK